MRGSYDEGAPRLRGETFAGALAELFGLPDRQQAVEDLLHEGVFDPEELIESLAAVLDLPELSEPPPDTAAVAYRGQHAIAQLAASIAGPALVGPPREGWSILAPSEGGEVGRVELAAGLSGAARRRDAVLEVWRAGSGCGWSPPRWPILSAIYAMGTAVAAVVCIAMTGLLVAVLVTDGAAWEATGTSVEDWAALVAFALLSLVLIPTAVYRIRRVIRLRHLRAR